MQLMRRILVVTLSQSARLFFVLFPFRPRCSFMNSARVLALLLVRCSLAVEP